MEEREGQEVRPRWLSIVFRQCGHLCGHDMGHRTCTEIVLQGISAFEALEIRRILLYHLYLVSVVEDRLRNLIPEYSPVTCRL